MTLEELKRLDAGIRFGREFKGERIPTLGEVFALTDRRCGLNIEIKAASLKGAEIKMKSPGGADANTERGGVARVGSGRAGSANANGAGGVEAICHLVCNQIVEHRALDTAMVSSFDWAALAIVRYLEPRIRIGLLASRWPARMVTAAFEMRADAINPRSDMVTEKLCIAAHRRNLSVFAWTVDEPSEMRPLIAYGVDGIMTNYPDRLRELMEH